MMGCDYSTNMPLIGFLFSGGILPLIFWSLIIFTIIFLIRTISRNNDRQHNSIASDRSDSLNILKKPDVFIFENLKRNKQGANRKTKHFF